MHDTCASWRVSQTWHKACLHHSRREKGQCRQLGRPTDAELGLCVTHVSWDCTGWVQPAWGPSECEGSMRKTDQGEGRAQRRQPREGVADRSGTYLDPNLYPQADQPCAGLSDLYQWFCWCRSEKPYRGSWGLPWRLTSLKPHPTLSWIERRIGLGCNWFKNFNENTYPPCKTIKKTFAMSVHSHALWNGTSSAVKVLYLEDILIDTWNLCNELKFKCPHFSTLWIITFILGPYFFTYI